MRPELTEPTGAPLQSRSILHDRTAAPALTRWVIGAIVVTALYFGRGVLIPIALSILLSFLLAPAVAGLRRLRFPRVAAVVVAVSLALGAITVTGTILFSQAATLAEDAPVYAEGIAEKASRLRSMFEDKFAFLVRESPDGGSGHLRAREARRSNSEALERRAADTEAIPVEVHDPPPSALQQMIAIASPAVGPIETTLIVLILSVFILIQRNDLRDRLVRLLGPADLHRTTIALDDGAKRLSRYFLSQFAVNCAFGAVIWVGLFLLGVPSPGLWGILAGLLRFVPYVGSLIALIGPLALAAAVDPGWTMMIGVVALFAIVEPLVGYVLEPLLYGRSTGLSPISVVVAAIFWTWLWGGLGLILSMPLTLMLVALGRHIPAFAFFDILLGDRPALSAPETFYQRILVGHVE
ncbi:MAG: tqsA 2, partial [Rhizorhabdus sp.]|nr:tqsA 2 [Rhizorhabdus sp.]